MTIRFRNCDTNNGAKKLFDNQKAIEHFQQIQDLYNQGLAEGKTPHDVLFKLMMERPDVAKAYLEIELPASLSHRVDWDSLQYQPTNFSEPTISEKRSDLLLSLELQPRKNQTDTETIYVYCMFEHQSTDDYTMAWRFFEYLYLWYSHYIKSTSDSKFPKMLPFVFPLVLYNGVTPWKSPTNFQELVNLPRGCTSFVPHFKFSLKDLSQIDDPDIQATYHRSFLLTKFLEYFKYSRRPEFYDRLLVDTEFVQLRDQRGDVLYAIFVYILQTHPQKQTSPQLTLKAPKTPYSTPYIQKVRNFKVESGWRIHNLSTGYQSEVYSSIRTFINVDRLRIRQRKYTFSQSIVAHKSPNPVSGVDW